MTNPFKKMSDHFWVRSHASEYIDDEMPSDDCKRLEKHRSICPSCTKLIRDLFETIKQLAGMKTEEKAPDSLADDVMKKLDADSGSRSSPL